MSEEKEALKQGRCPRCGKAFTYTNVASHKPFPFCSPRCRDVDLGNWLSGKYAIPGQSIVQPSDENDEASEAT